MALTSFCKHVRLTSNYSWIIFARVIAVSYLLTMLSIQGVFAIDKVWNGPNLAGDWDGDNWTPGGDPPDGIGFFDTVGNTVTVVNPATVGEINFTASPNTFNINSEFTLDAAGITGPNASGVTFTINSEGTLAFTNAAAAAGAAITNNGAVDISGITGAGTSIGSLSGAGNVNLGAKTLTLGALGLDDLLSGEILGSGSLTKIGGGNLTLSGGNSYTGGTTITGGTLTGNTDSLTGNIVNNAALVFDQAGAGTFAGGISGSGTLTKSGGGNLALTGTNTYTGGTTITVGTLTGNTDSLTGNIVNNAALIFDQFEDGTFNGTISGTGTFTKTGDGNLILTGGNSYTGGTTITDGILTGNTTSLTGDILNNAALVFDQAAAGTFAGVINGSGTLTKSGAGNLVLAGANTYTGGTTITAGILTGNTTSLTGNIVNNAALVFDQAAAGTFAGSISGSGTLTKSGAGNLTLTGTNTYTGGTTIIGGILTGNTTSLTGNIVNNAAFVFDQVGAGTFAGSISGNGTLTKSGAGNLILTGANTYTGGTTITAGILTGNTTSLTGNIINNAALVFNQTAAGTFGGVISGGGTLTKTGKGNLTLTGVNTYTGGTTITGGTLTGNATSLTGNIVNNAALVFDQAGAGTFTGVISGKGTLTKAGKGNLTLTGANTYTGGTTITAGILTGNTTSLTGNIVNNAALVFDQAGAGTFAGVISGSGTLTKAGKGNLTLTGVNTYTGGTTITAGILTGNTTSLTGNIVNNAALVFNQAGAGTFGGVISGSGTLTKSGAGNLTLKGANTYAGGTIITGGILTGSTTSLTGNIVNNAALVFDQAAAGKFEGVISGGGTLTKSGVGNLTLTGNSPYSGNTLVSAGTLTVNGTLPNSAVSVASGATIMGTGSMKSLALDGIIAPGSSIGTLTIANDFTMSSSSQYNAEVSMSGASDLIAVGGGAQLNGALSVLSSDSISSLSGKTHTILTAGKGVTGQFNSTEFNNERSTIYNVTYNPQSVSITFPTISDVTPRVRIAETVVVEQQAWGSLDTVSTQQTTIVQNEPVGKTDGACAAAFPMAFNKLVERQKSLALNSRGIIPPMGRKNRYVGAPDVETRVIPISERIKIGKTNVWMQNYDQASWLKGSTGATSKTYGGALGADYEIVKNTFLGFFGGSSSSPIHMKSDLGKSRVKSYYGGAYATRTTSVGTYVSGQIMAGGNNYHTHRNINFGNFNLKALSKHRGGQFFSRVEVGQVVPFSEVVALPFLNVGYGLVHEQRSTEKGAGIYNFATNHQNAQSMRGEIGTRIYRTYNIKEAFIRPEFDISYILTRGIGSRNGKGHFVGDPLTVSLPGGRRTLNQVAPGFSLSALFKEGLYIIGGVNSQLSGPLKTVSATATVGYNF